MYELVHKQSYNEQTVYIHKIHQMLTIIQIIQNHVEYGENTINEEEEGDPADAPIGIIINESSEDGQGINDVVMVGDQLADKDDLEETLLEWATVNNGS